MLRTSSSLLHLVRPSAVNVELLPRIEGALEAAFRACAVGPQAPPRFVKAQRYALFPGGNRLRPQLCLIAALACGDRRPAVADAAAAAI
ncbi:MAG: hypothetical protein ABI461_03115, partial [Polyangiaceae bacterium]